MQDDLLSGKAVGGKARAASLSPERRKEISDRALESKRELANLPKATHGSADHPLRIGDAEIPCYVLEDGTRVLSQRGMVAGLGMTYGSGQGGADRLTGFAVGKGISPFINNEMMLLIQNPIRFRHNSGGGVAFGYPATLLADICDAVLEARKAGKLQKQQEHIAHQAEVLVRGFARVGIIALVDEATGYQRDRERNALAKILEAFVAKELQPYVKTFPADYYENLFRLRGLPYPPEKAQYKPQYFGVLTNDVVYERLAPGLLKELKNQAAKDEKKARLHQRLTSEVGHPKLREHLASVVTIMKLSSTYPDFIQKMDAIHPKYGDTKSLL
ncbi:P63C domain-containing protein [Stenotrophomonas indicatrix]|uniref:P63C domain-containing protein n=1 Tax=Stenotrophomonas indicatrix TaxID=2045451 RepID=UPI0008B0E5B5|nr:P63C domain-containing protein [Stenotrophomonas indicatrix]SET67015.1 P63C domain-containing protein [Stenotrophomonas indicatrix]